MKGLLVHLLFLAAVLLSTTVPAVSAAFGVYSPVVVPKIAPTTATTSTASNGGSRRRRHGGMFMRARECDLLGKRANRQACVVTFSHRRIKKVQQVNLQWKRFYSENLGRTVTLRLSTKGIKTVNKIGNIDEAAKKFDVDLSKF